jgi:uncharacterized membrane protein YphA (DoxX/SURF4 family)
MRLKLYGLRLIITDIIMTLTTLLIRIAIAAVILTLILGFGFKKHKSILMTFLQNFCGVLFIFSGLVKAVDPLGTAYKMEQYFDAFYTTFEGTWMSFIAPMFPFLAKYAIGFSVGMIVFEIVLGVMLILGMRSKLTAWMFLLLVIFFTILTGFTYLTGYVPPDVNFFQFGQWAEFNKNNMQVQDCGCFGDYIKLVPKTSFFKDVFLLFPAFYFLFRHKDMHQLFNAPIRTGLVTLTTVGLLFYCLSNFVWDIPKNDFRPFKKGADIRQVREQEEEAMAAVQITAWKIESLSTGEQHTIPYDDYLANYSTKYSKDKFKVVDQIKGEPTIEPTKISEFEVTDLRGNDISDDIVYSEEAHFLIVNYQLKGDPKRRTEMIKDSIYLIDTVQVMDNDMKVEKEQIIRTLDRVEDKEVTVIDQNFDKDYLSKHIDILKPFTDAAKAKGLTVRMAIGKSDPEVIKEFDKVTGLELDYGMADDILLKTIVRSNPGVVLWKDGKILDKWHINKLPDFESVAKEYGL